MSCSLSTRSATQSAVDRSLSKATQNTRLQGRHSYLPNIMLVSIIPVVSRADTLQASRKVCSLLSHLLMLRNNLPQALFNHLNIQLHHAILLCVCVRSCGPCLTYSQALQHFLEELSQQYASIQDTVQSPLPTVLAPAVVIQLLPPQGGRVPTICSGSSDVLYLPIACPSKWLLLLYDVAVVALVLILESPA